MYVCKREREIQIRSLKAGLEHTEDQKSQNI